MLDGTVIGQCQKRHRHQEFLGFLRKLHLIVDNYATHKHAKVKEWLAKHPRFHFHFTPTSASWLNLRDAIRRGAFKSVPELEATINDYLAKHNDTAKPFVWTATAQDILEKIDRARQALALNLLNESALASVRP